MRAADPPIKLPDVMVYLSSDIEPVSTAALRADGSVARDRRHEPGDGGREPAARSVTSDSRHVHASDQAGLAYVTVAATAGINEPVEPRRSVCWKSVTLPRRSLMSLQVHLSNRNDSIGAQGIVILAGTRGENPKFNYPSTVGKQA
jgi:hypothetical protein